MTMIEIIQPKIRKIIRKIKQTNDNNFIGFDKYAKKGAFHWEELAHNEYYKAKVETVSSYLSSEHNCLDIGCGDGAYAAFLANKCKYVFGVDADYEAIRLAKLKASQEQTTNCEFIQAPISKINTKTLGIQEKLDLIYSMDVIEHLPQPEELLQAALNIIKPRGLILIGTPLFITPELVSRYHVKEFTIEEIRDLVSSYLSIQKEILLPISRKDGKIHDDNFYISVGSPKI
jgi:2-polyprenyl-3-methyl-5-hydroxy-6-metoxy-1,4-benzoquinol methylase